MIVHDDAALESFGDGAALVRNPIEGQGLGRDRMQPMPFAGDAKTSFVKMAPALVRQGR
jgi:hypothetical protein